MDPLSQMWAMQRTINLRCGINPTRFDMKDIVHWTKEYLHALNQEGSELLDSLPWKWWRPVDAQTADLQNARVEVVDMMHFLISLAQVLGMSSDDMFRIYSEKNQVNHNRQDSGYFVKDENDCKEIV